MPNPIVAVKNKVEDIERFIQIVKILVGGLRSIVQQINDLEKPTA